MHTLIAKLKESLSKGDGKRSSAPTLSSLLARYQPRGLPLLPVRHLSLYERNSTIIPSNKSFSDSEELFSDSVIASAILDRLLHHCKVINIKGHVFGKQLSQQGDDSLISATPE